MIGTIFAFIWGIATISAAWTKDTSGETFSSTFINLLPIVGIFTLVGVFLFPRTVGTALGGIVLATPIAFVIGIFRNSFSFALSILAWGLCAWIVTVLIAKLRPNSTY